MVLYDQLVAMTVGFVTFLDSCHKVFSDGVNGTNWWSKIANSIYIPSIAQERSSILPIHQFISSSINMRKDDDKVASLDVFYLWCIIMSSTFCNIPYCLENTWVRVE